MVRCIVFDLDGTLVDTGNLFYRLFGEVIHSAGLPPVRFEEVGDAWASARAQASATYPQLRDTHKEPGFMELWEQVLEEMLSDGAMRLYPDAYAALSGLRASGRRLCLASNTPKPFVQMKLAHFALGPHFEAIFTPQDRWGPKPNPASLLHLMDLFDLRAHEIAMVGDLPPDILYGKNAGVRTIAILNQYNDRDALAAAEPDCMIGGLAELAEAMAALERGDS